MDIKDTWRQNLDAMLTHNNSYQLPSNFYHNFLATVHSFHLPVAAKQRYMQSKKLILKRVEVSVCVLVLTQKKVSSVWESMVDEDMGRPIHQVRGSAEIQIKKRCWMPAK